MTQKTEHLIADNGQDETPAYKEFRSVKLEVKTIEAEIRSKKKRLPTVPETKELLGN